MPSLVFSTFLRECGVCGAVLDLLAIAAPSRACEILKEQIVPRYFLESTSTPPPWCRRSE